MEDIKNAILERVNNKFLGSFIVAFVVCNYKAISVFALGDFDIVDKLEYITEHYCNVWLLAVYPLLYASFYILTVPWLIRWVDKYNNIANYYREMDSQKHQRRILQSQKSILKEKQEVADIQVELKTQDQKLNQHDIEMFIKNDSILSESKIRDCINTIRDSQRCSYNTIGEMEGYIDNSNLSSNTYINKEVKMLHKKFVASLSDLMSFISQHFFAESNLVGDNPVLGLYPERRKEEFFRIHADLLVKLADEVHKNYTDYRLYLKENLEV